MILNEFSIWTWSASFSSFYCRWFCRNCPINSSFEMTDFSSLKWPIMVWGKETKSVISNDRNESKLSVITMTDFDMRMTEKFLIQFQIGHCMKLYCRCWIIAYLASSWVDSIKYKLPLTSMLVYVASWFHNDWFVFNLIQWPIWHWIEWVNSHE